MHLMTIMPALLLQTEGITVSGLTQGQVTVLMIFAGAVTLAVIIQCGILVSFALAGAKARKEILGLITQMHGKAMPLLTSVQAIVDETTPKVRKITSNAVEISEIARSKAVEIDALVSDLTRKTQKQAAHVDQITTDALNGAQTITHSVQHAIMAPVKQFVGAVAAVKAAVDRLKTRVTPKAADPYAARYGSKYDSHEGEERMGEGEDYHA